MLIMKTTTKERLNRYKNSFLETPKNHPVEMGLALTIVFVNGFNIITNAWSHAMMLYLCILVAFIFGHYKEQLWCRVPYYATFVVGIATLFFDVKPIVNLQAFDILMYLSVVGAFIVPRSNSNNEFVARSFRLGINVALAFIVFLLFFIDRKSVV